jgi:hypothetical protein
MKHPHRARTSWTGAHGSWKWNEETPVGEAVPYQRARSNNNEPEERDVEFENETVRVLRCKYASNVREPLHEHVSGERLTVALDDVELSVTTQGSARKRWQRFRIVMSSMAQKRATGENLYPRPRHAGVAYRPRQPVAGNREVIRDLSEPRQRNFRMARQSQSGRSMLSGVIHFSLQIFFLSPLTLTLRDPRECKVAVGTNVVSAEKKPWHTQSDK